MIVTEELKALHEFIEIHRSTFHNITKFRRIRFQPRFVFRIIQQYVFIHMTDTYDLYI